LWRALDETRKEILPDGMATPTERTTEDLSTIVDSWLQYGDLSIVAKRQSANNVAYGKRVRTDREHPWMVTMHDGAVRREGGWQNRKLWEEGVGQMALGFEKGDAPLHLQRRMQKPPRPWQRKPRGEKTAGRPSVVYTARGPTSLGTPRSLTQPPPTGQATTIPAVAAGRTGVAPGRTTAAAGRATAVVTTEAEGRAPEALGW
jgi:hypothetical protein